MCASVNKGKRLNNGGIWSDKSLEENRMTRNDSGSVAAAVTTPSAVRTILIVDDDPSVTETFERMLRLEGYHVVTALSADAGLNQAEKTNPHAIILDLRMPLCDGLGFLRRLRATDTQRLTPVAIVTGDYFLEDEISSELRALGAELRFKPMWLEDLVGLARNLLDRSSTGGRSAGATH